MKYKIKAYLIKPDTNTLDCRFHCLLDNFDDVVEFLSRVSLMAYDVVKVFPTEYESEV